MAESVVRAAAVVNLNAKRLQDKEDASGSYPVILIYTRFHLSRGPAVGLGSALGLAQAVNQNG